VPVAFAKLAPKDKKGIVGLVDKDTTVAPVSKINCNEF